MNILVTGGAGYIGSHACKALRRAGFTPIVYDNLSMGHEWAVKWGPLEKGDIRDLPRLQEVFQKYPIAAVMHFAALASVAESVKRPELYQDNNVIGSLRLLEAMKVARVETIVFSSTCATYGVPTQSPITEDHPLSPINPYGESKRVTENLIRTMGFRSVSLRYFNAAGADADGEIGECHHPEPHLIPNALAAAAGRCSDLVIYGDNYETPDGTCIRDYIHVTDLVEAHLQAIQGLLAQKTLPTAINLGSSHGYSVKQVVNEVQNVTGKRVPFQIGARREGDPPRLVADGRLANSSLGWEPTQSRLGHIIRSAWNWHQKIQK